MRKNDYQKVPSPKVWPNANERLIVGAGAPVDSVGRVSIFSAAEFENFVAQWASEYLEKQYPSVEMPRGARDKGRDIICWLDPESSSPRRWHNYQCKHYKDPLTNSDIYVELGKILYYTFVGDYSVPEKSYFVCNKGVGPTLSDDLKQTDELRRKLIKNWDTHCKTKISSKLAVELEGAFKEYVDKFDFKIFGLISPVDLINQHAKTRYHSLIFGTALKKRGPIQPPPVDVVAKENRYVEQLFESYSDHLGTTVVEISELKNSSEPDLAFHYQESRMAFYSAESLSEFARDNLPPQENFFDDLTEKILVAINPTVRKIHSNGYQRLLSAVETANSLPLDQHVLESSLLSRDREGICHQLANKDKVTWTRKKNAGSSKTI